MKNWFILIVLACPLHGWAQSEDAYTRYELLDPASHSFRIIYDVTSVEDGATRYYNTLRKGSDHIVSSVIDVASGKQLKWAIVTGGQAKKEGYVADEDDGEYLQVSLAHPVPAGGGYRLRIDKTYSDVQSYSASGDKILFDRPLGVRRNSVVLPAGYELVGCNYPSQVQQEADGRIKISFLNAGASEVPLKVEGRKSATIAKPEVAKPSTASGGPGEGRNKSQARLDFTFPERAYQTREIVYFLQQPETHSFRLYHDYTETREGMDRYVNVVRPGSKASNPSAKNLDTGAPLKVETLKGDEIKKRNLDIGEPVTPKTEIVVIWYEPVKKGESVRLRIEETYTDANRYLLHNTELVFDRSFGRPFNAVVLPEGWYLTSSYIPATVSLTKEGLVQLMFVNNSPDEIDVFLKARRR